MATFAETASAPTQPARPWAARAAVSELSVRQRHLRRVWALPRTLLGVGGWPASIRERVHVDWNHWCQIQLLECLLDAQLRHPSAARRRVIKRLVRGLHVRNGRLWSSEFYDDMASAGLVLLRIREQLGMAVDPQLRAIAARLRDAWSDHAGGGIWWRRDDDLKNTSANGPGAILLARMAAAEDQRADLLRAMEMAEWIEDNLVDAETGLVWDGLRVRADGTVREVVTEPYTYCQGVFVGACLELAGHGDPVWTERVERTIFAVVEYLAEDGVLYGQGGGDGGLFAGILARHLAEAVLRLPELGASEDSVDLAEWLVFTSADAAWRNRAVVLGGPLYGPEWSVPARVPQAPNLTTPERDLTVQLGGWMLVEAAAMLERHR